LTSLLWFRTVLRIPMWRTGQRLARYLWRCVMWSRA
jgi:hypothetical protein